MRLSPTEMFRTSLGEYYFDDAIDAAGYFHGGQSSELYKLSSTGTVDNAERLIAEISRCADEFDWESDEESSETTAADRLDVLLQFASWLEKNAETEAEASFGEPADDEAVAADAPAPVADAPGEAPTVDHGQQVENEEHVGIEDLLGNVVMTKLGGKVYRHKLESYENGVFTVVQAGRRSTLSADTLLHAAAKGWVKIAKGSIGTSKEFAAQVEATLRSLFPRGHVSSRYSGLGGQESVSVWFAAEPKAEWSNGIFHNSETYHIFSVHGFDKDGKAGDKLTVEPLSTGVPREERKTLKLVKKTGSADQILAHLTNYFTKFRDKIAPA
jgi:hypothetical protein